MNEQDVLGAFLLVNNPIVLSEEEVKDVQKAIKKLQQENQKYKEVIDKAIEFIEENMYSYYDNNGEKCIEETVFERSANPKELLNILQNKEVSE